MVNDHYKVQAKKLWMCLAWSDSVNFCENEAIKACAKKGQTTEHCVKAVKAVVRAEDKWWQLDDTVPAWHAWRVAAGLALYTQRHGH